MSALTKLVLTFTVFAFLTMAPGVAEAQNCVKNPNHPKCQLDPDPDPVPSTWIHPDVGVAHGQSFDGTGSYMITVDNFFGSSFSGNLTGTDESLNHGQWTYLQSSLVAPGALGRGLDHNENGATNISTIYGAIAGVNVVNLSFGLFDPAGTNVGDPNYTLGSVLWDSLVTEAIAGTAIFVKAAGNTSGGTVDGTVRMRFGSPRPQQAQDVLNLSLIGAQGAIFVGALDGNGTTSNPASIASYSTIAGSTTAIQDMFLVVGVEDSVTGLAGTSFGAPIVTGYAAILGNKFNSATPGAIVDQLLSTAREDTILGYDVSIHGQGEASLFNALSPIDIPF